LNSWIKEEIFEFCLIELEGDSFTCRCHFGQEHYHRLCAACSYILNKNVFVVFCACLWKKYSVHADISTMSPKTSKIVFVSIMHWHKLGEVENECTSHNYIVLVIFVPKIIKVGGNMTIFW